MTQTPFANEFPIGRLTGQCARCGQALQPGQPYYAVIWHRDTDYVRQDFDEACWTEPPADALGVWRARVPVPQERPRRQQIPTAVLMKVFERLGEAEGAEPHKLRFVLALLLMRRRLLRHLDTVRQDGYETWRMRRPADDMRFDVVSPPLSSEDVDALSQQLLDLLSGLDDQAESL